MKSSKHFVIFSHGFGVRKDARGIFTDIAPVLQDIEPVMFDYNEINEAENTITITPLRRQAEILKEVLRVIKTSAPDAIVDIISHSQGAIAVALAMPEGIRKTIFLAPPVGISSERMLVAFRSRPGSEINMKGISRIVRRDGSITLVPADYWTDRKDLKPIELYNKFARETNLTIIKAVEDEVLGEVSFEGLSSDIKILPQGGDHNFSEDARKPLVEVVKRLLS